MTSLALATATLFVAQAQAALLVDGFESVTGSTNLTGDFDPASPPWTTTETYDANVLVYAAPPVGLPVHSGGQALRMRSSQGSTIGAFDASGQISDGMYLYEPASNTDFRTLNISLRNAAGSTTAVNLSFNTETGVGWGLGYFDSTNAFHKVANVATGAWAGLTIDADVDTQKFTLTYNGTLYNNGGAGFAFYNTTADLGQLRFSYSTDNHETYIDDVLVIPEPSSAGLLLGVGVVGTLMSLGRRRRK